MKLVFMGTPDFSVPILESLIEAGHQVICVYSQPPRPAGRGHKEQLTPVHAFAHQRNIPVRTPKSLKSPEAQAEFAALDADVAIANPGGEHACAAVSTVDMEPPVVLRRNVGRGGEIVDDPGIRGAARRDDRRYIAQIMIGGEGLA